MLELFDGVDRDIARPRHDGGATLERRVANGEHLLHEHRGAVASGLGANEGATPIDALAGDDAALVAVRDPLVLTEQVPDLAATDADVTGGHVGVLAEVAVQLGHEALAEAHHLVVAAALGVEVAATLAAADRQPGQRILEGLFETEELDDAEVH